MKFAYKMQNWKKKGRLTFSVNALVFFAEKRIFMFEFLFFVHFKKNARPKTVLEYLKSLNNHKGFYSFTISFPIDMKL